MENKPVIAIYDVRGIQDYIFRTNKVKEIVGASLIVDNLVISEFKKAIKDNTSINENEVVLNWGDKAPLQFEDNETIKVEVLYYGGGNLVVLFRNEDLAKNVSITMSKNILRNAYGLSLNYTFVSKTENYQEDWRALKLKLSEIKATTPLNKPMGILPIVQYDRVTGLPLSKQMSEGDRTVKVTYEAYQKINKYNSDKNDTPYVKEFDKMRANESEGLIAIVHIDGNSMGQNIGKLMQNAKTYKEATRIMRGISCNIHQVFEKEAIEKVISKMNDICKKHGISNLIKDGKYPFRKIISAGDDITFVCNARISLDIVKEYIESIKCGYMYEKQYPFSACAGIAIVHSHFPFYKGYEIAEECCQNAKKRAKSEKGMVNGKIGNFVDFQYCYAGITSDLESIRKNKYINIEGYSLLKRPYGIFSEEEKKNLNEEQKEFDIDILYRALNDVKNISRNKAKDLRDIYYQTKADIDTEVKKLKLKNKALPLKEMFDANNTATYYDALEFLDLYAEKKNNEENEEEGK